MNNVKDLFSRLQGEMVDSMREDKMVWIEIDSVFIRFCRVVRYWLREGVLFCVLSYSFCF